MEDTYEQHLEWTRQRRERLALSLSELLAGEGRPLTLEIGCGHGHWLVDYAAANPQRRCLGVDLIADRVERADRKKRAAGLDNVDFLKAEAFETLDALPSTLELEAVFILFPDPWPKKRHWKNRIFNPDFFRELGKRCPAGVSCHFRTDHRGYFEWAEELLPQLDGWKRDQESAWPFESETVFQQKADDGYQSLILVKQ